MRKSRIEAAETRQKIVALAAGEFRLNGIHETGLQPLMSKAGLTHGGFYRHFDSKDQLVAEACTLALQGLVDGFEAAAGAAGEEGFKAIVGGYLSAAHRDDHAGGCPLAGMGSELVRADRQTRQAAAQGFHDLVEVMAKNMDHQQPAAARSQAVFAMAAMLGAVTISRIIADPQASMSVLQDVKQHLNAM